jgi:hyperosmotically inducible protein
MKQPIKRIALATLTASALSLSLASTAFAQPADAVQPTLLAANASVDKAEQAVSDTWITSKVKSSFIADQSLSGLDIKVETNQGVVALSGVVASEAERDLAVAKAQEIEGVKAVSAEALKTAD